MPLVLKISNVYSVHEVSFCIIILFVILLLVYLSGRTKNQVATDSLHRLSVVVPKDSLLTLDQITEILKETDTNSSIKRYERTASGFEVMFIVKIPDLVALSAIQKRLNGLDKNLELTILDARPII